MNWYNLEHWAGEYYYTDLDCRLTYSHYTDGGIRSYCNDSLVDTYQLAVL